VTREQALQELRDAGELAERQSDINELKALFYRIQGLAQQFPQDAEVQTQASRARQSAVTRGKQLQEKMSAPAENREAVTAMAVVAKPAVRNLPAPLVVAPPPEPIKVYRPATYSAWRWWIPLLVGPIVGLLMAIPVIYSLTRKTDLGPPQTDTTKGIPVGIRTNPSGAFIKIDGRAVGTANLVVPLQVGGEYQVEATLDGFQTVLATAKPEFGRDLTLDLTLNPLPTALRILTDFETGVWNIDNGPNRPLEAGQAFIDSVSPGEHTFRVTSRDMSGTFALGVEPGKLPAIKSVSSTKNLVLLVMSALNGNVRMLSSDTSGNSVSIDGKSVGVIKPEGLELNLGAGEHELLWNAGGIARKMGVAAVGNPTATAYLKLDLDAGTLVVQTGEDDVQVFVDNREMKQRTKRGQLRLPNLEVRKYKVRIAKNGFLEVGEQEVEIRKGEETRVVFKLKPQPKFAQLQLAGVLPGATVLLDGQSLGAVRGDGSFSSANIQPGDHAIEIRAEKHTIKTLRASFEAGKTVNFSGRDVQLDLAKGQLRINVTPNNARLQIRRDSEKNSIPVTSNPLNLNEGNYIVTASAPEAIERTFNVNIEAGQTKTLDIKLAVFDRPKEAPKTMSGGMEGFEGSFVRDGEWFVKKGGGRVMYRAGGAGSYSFSIFTKKATGIFRSSKVQFYVDYSDEKNYVLYQLEDKKINRITVQNGKKKSITLANKMENMEFYGLTVDVKGDAVSLRGKGVGTIDSFSLPGSDVTDGKFGILIQGNDEVAVGDFRFSPK
jgi:hypothetical protein